MEFLFVVAVIWFVVALVVNLRRRAARKAAEPRGGAEDAFSPSPSPNPASNLEHGPHLYVDKVLTLKRAGRLEEARLLLLELVDATEAESRATGEGVAPWFYEQLALIYRKQKDPVNEKRILVRFAKQVHAIGATPLTLLERLQAIGGDDRLDLDVALKAAENLKWPGGPPRQKNRRKKRNTADWPTLLDREDVLVVDVETTGVGDRAEVVEVGIVDTTGVERLHVLSMPQSRMPRDASDIHGLTRDVLRQRDAQRWPTVHDTVVDAVAGAAVVLAWNAPFDSRLLRQTAERHGLAFPELPWRCAQQDYGGRKALVVAAVEVGLTVSDAHDALTDARRVLDILRAQPAARKPRKRERKQNKCAPHRWLLPEPGAPALTCEACGRHIEAGDQAPASMDGIVSNIARLHGVTEVDVRGRLSHPGWTL